MAGVAGIIRFDGSPVLPEEIEGMTSSMRHRGPDGIGYWRDSYGALGHCQLFTTSESKFETQPLANDTGDLVLVWDGRLDNWHELRQYLLSLGVMLRDRSDAELVLRAYELWGEACVAHFDGDFAFAIMARNERKVFLARDRVGNKPLYYFRANHVFVFASEVRAILGLPWIERRPNLGMVAEYLAQEWMSRDETFWANIFRLVPAHAITVSPSKFSISCYWSPDLDAPLRYAREEEYVEHYRSLFTDIVRRMSRSHAPLACEVSGGLDSSAIFGVLADLQRRGDCLAPGLRAYTLNFEGQGDADEVAYARSVCALHGEPLREVPPTSPPLDWYQARAAATGEFPGYPNGIMSVGIRQEARAEGCRALLVGVGGDEWLDDEPTYYAQALAERRYQEFFRYFFDDVSERGLAAAAWLVLRHNIVPTLPEPLKRVLRAIAIRAGVERRDLAAWLLPEMLALLRRRREGHRQTWEQLRPRKIWQRNQVSYLIGAYGDHARSMEERVASELGVELRRPFWSSRLVQFSLSTPVHMRCRGAVHKFTHRQAMKGLLPGAILRRHDKADFGCTFLHYEATALVNALRRRQDGGARSAEWVGALGLKTEADRFRAVEDQGLAVWALWTLFGTDAVVPV